MNTKPDIMVHSRYCQQSMDGKFQCYIGKKCLTIDQLWSSFEHWQIEGLVRSLPPVLIKSYGDTIRWILEHTDKAAMSYPQFFATHQYLNSKETQQDV